MRITAKKNIIINSKHVAIGETVDTDSRTAKDLVNMGLCEIAADPVVEAPAEQARPAKKRKAAKAEEPAEEPEAVEESEG